jgi:hypothetical protein
MTVPSPKSAQKGGLWRLRKREDGKTKWRCSCFRIIIWLLALQVTMFVVVMKTTHRHASSLISTHYNDRRQEFAESLRQKFHLTPSVKDDDDFINEEAKKRLAKFEEGDEMQIRVIYSDDHSSEALDNYGSRRHLAKKDAWNKSSPYLIVGGSDGSGTRAVVNHLISLGTFMHVSGGWWDSFCPGEFIS